MPPSSCGGRGCLIGNPEKQAKILFCYDNPPGTTEISGAQDTIGIVYPGLALSYYEGEYWPSRIESMQDELMLQFVEQALYLIPMGPRESGYSVLSDTNITRDGAKALADATEGCWDAILAQDIKCVRSLLPCLVRRADRDVPAYDDADGAPA